MKRYSGDYKFVDPYNITSSLTKAYEDTEDGMHMGFWINLQKAMLALNSTYTLYFSCRTIPIVWLLLMFEGVRKSA